MTKINFEIKSIDPLGQGVSKNSDKIPRVLFVSKTLPGETGVAELTKINKKIGFGFPLEIKNTSKARITPECEHYSKCAGCHFLHTNYTNELHFKVESFQFLCRPLPGDFNFHVHSAVNRFHYRNRIQLHYDKNQKQLGLMDTQHKIIPVPKCLIAVPEIQLELTRLYSCWEELLAGHKKKGHIELYLLPTKKKVKVSVNMPYSSGGFSQVNEEMNRKLQEFVFEQIEQLSPRLIVDLFGGNGNLTRQAESIETLVVDSTSGVKLDGPHQKYLKLNLYDKNAVKKLSLRVNQAKCDLLIVDPPRSGLKNIDEFAKMLDPKYIIYVSCMPQTLVRDIKNLIENYDISSAHLFDLFPSTYHFESLIVLKRK